MVRVSAHNGGTMCVICFWVTTRVRDYMNLRGIPTLGRVINSAKQQTCELLLENHLYIYTNDLLHKPQKAGHQAQDNNGESLERQHCHILKTSQLKLIIKL
ncbi:hypothetical protein POM88_046289 [Heracleum sosnowskyi]|uniref:Uncharacterized protein n=1 Tax=Heracleum sosnowskyi TaxID=360622 RepID=A0AAD8M4J5_9APIA|nr:hypothetical protein POM88_046289 [Heracleum sosnowskyi]